MRQFSVTRRLPFRATDLLAIAADVRRYPEFVPLCVGARVWDERSDAEGRRHFRAAFDVAYPKLRIAETLSSDVTVDPVALWVRALSHSGPVRHLDNRWLFHELLRGGTDVDLWLAYEMSSRPLKLLMSGMFDYAMRKIINAFEERAYALYEPVG
jgi:coenzyme Q-binding protein COQ10